MPMRRMLEGGTFDPKAVAILSEVFEAVVAELDLRDIAEREKAAKIIIRIAQGQATLDEGELRDEAVRLMCKEDVRGRRRAF